MDFIGGAAGGAAEGLEQVLRRLFLEQQQRQQAELARESMNVQMRGQGVQMRGQDLTAGAARDRLGLDKEKFEEDKSQFRIEQPIRGRFMNAQATNLENQPARDEANRAHDEFMAGLGDKFTRGQIRLRGDVDAGLIDKRAASGGGDAAGQFTSVQQGIGPDGKPALLIVDRRSGTAQPVQMPGGFSPNRPARPVTGQERREYGFFQRMLDAERAARKVEDTVGTWDTAIAARAPDWLQNWLQTAEGQQYAQAQRAFTEGRLRADSGAAVPASEYEADRTKSFRIGGETSEAVKQKRATRLTEMRAQAARAGRALQEQFGEDSTVDSILSEFADPASPKVGEEKTFPNGKKGRWDGKGWVLIGG